MSRLHSAKKILLMGAEGSGCGAAEIELVRKIIESSGSGELRTLWHRTTSFVKGEDVLPPASCASFARAIDHDGEAFGEDVLETPVVPIRQATPAPAAPTGYTTLRSWETSPPRSDVGPSVAMDSVPSRHVSPDPLNGLRGRLVQTANNRYVYLPPGIDTPESVESVGAGKHPGEEAFERLSSERKLAAISDTKFAFTPKPKTSLAELHAIADQKLRSGAAKLVSREVA